LSFGINKLFNSVTRSLSYFFQLGPGGRLLGNNAESEDCLLLGKPRFRLLAGLSVGYAVKSIQIHPPL
jgi:hypothetical protein